MYLMYDNKWDLKKDGPTLHVYFWLSIETFYYNDLQTGQMKPPVVSHCFGASSTLQETIQ